MKKILTILMLLFSLTLMAVKTHSPDMANCVGYWSLNENSLNSAQAFTDLSGNSNLGTSANVPTFSADQNGCNSQSQLFNGTTDLINCGSDTSIDNIFDGGGTVSVWINPSSDGESGGGRIFDKRNVGSGWMIQFLSQTGNYVKLRFYYNFSVSNGNWETTSAIIPINAWSHVVYTYDNGISTNNPILYINSVPYTVGSGLSEIAPSPSGTRVSDATQILYIGNNLTEALTFDGSLSDCLIYNTALTSDQVSKLYEAGRSTATVEMDDSSTSYLTYPTTTGNLVLDMPLCAPYVAGWDGSNYLITKDLSYSQADGTVSGATITADGYDFDGTNDIITISGLTNAKSIGFWMSPGTTTEAIFEETDDVGVSVSSGTISYGSWDNCFVDGVDTDTVTTGWHHIILTSTTNVDISALRLGLVNATYYDGYLKVLKGWSVGLSTTEITYEYNTSWRR